MASIVGTGADDTLNGTGAADTIRGLGGDDSLDGGGGADSVDGGDGDDAVIGHAGDTLKGGAGVDRLILTSHGAAATFDLSALTSPDTAVISAGGDLKVSGFEWVQVAGGDFDDHIVGSSLGDLVTGAGGADTVFAGEGDDFIAGGAGDDSLDGGDGVDRIGFDGDALGGATVDLRLQGGAQVTGAGLDVLNNFENVSGTQFGDVLIGDANSNILWGVGTVADILAGDDGEDLLIAGDGAHTINGGDGLDALSLDGDGSTSAGVHVDLNLQGAAPQDTGVGMMQIRNIENLSGTVHADALIGDFWDNLLAGVDGADTLQGGAGADKLYGDGAIYGDFVHGLSGPIVASEALYGDDAAPGGDSLDGGKGDDILVGGGGADTMTGGKGVDAFWYFRLEDSAVGAQDLITDFNQNYDVLDFAAIDADATADGDQAFTLVYAFTNTAGEAQVAYDRVTATTTLSLDVDGDGVADAAIVVGARLTIVGLEDGSFIA
jgi:Ca2+-binding RTX toxin-like protein